MPRDCRQLRKSRSMCYSRLLSTAIRYKFRVRVRVKLGRGLISYVSSVIQCKRLTYQSTTLLPQQHASHASRFIVLSKRLLHRASSTDPNKCNLRSKFTTSANHACSANSRSSAISPSVALHSLPSSARPSPMHTPVHSRSPRI